MGLTIHLQDESGNIAETILDETNLLHTALPAVDDDSFYYINRIDWYGDTIFNRLQMEDLIRELRELIPEVVSSEEKTILAEIVALAQRGIEKPHMYLKFCGD